MLCCSVLVLIVNKLAPGDYDEERVFLRVDPYRPPIKCRWRKISRENQEIRIYHALLQLPILVANKLEAGEYDDERVLLRTASSTPSSSCQTRVTRSINARASLRYGAISSIACFIPWRWGAAARVWEFVKEPIRRNPQTLPGFPCSDVKNLNQESNEVFLVLRRKTSAD